MIKLKIREVVSADQALGVLADLDVPPQAAFDIARVARAIQAEMEIYQRKRDKLLDEHGERRQATEEEKKSGLGPEVIQVKAEHLKAFNEAIDALLDVETELAVNPLDLKRLGDIRVKPRDVFMLGPLVKE